ncbi:UvrD/REP helicase N-terminal domain-containing protein [Anoxybacillus vitaminiphilus]|uniref:UvrD/REP helicase N-terminal domain-containing protein n=1 Tax=Paranoxybacillus vitaminiphilus TaxID=581036 RepID=A0A327XZ55_9BACL|nr:UvrD-helicase domain-containing protein [Anoxybacillus vitaminiphilus]RAK14020.1 UvrD/REP helicase N-terminal domain-containing protein [Anoxybacillus vitaminiphilus]
MKVLALDKFYKSVPKEKEQRVKQKVISLVQELEKNGFDFERLPNGFGLRKVETVNKPIYKFKVDSSDRILCSMGGKFYSNIREEYINCLVLLEYCSHDSQIRIAKDREFTKQGIQEYEKDTVIVVTDTNNEEKSIDLSLTNSTPIIIDKNRINEIFGEEGRFYYLDDIQDECVQSYGKGQFVLGTAGSGKTTIGVYKLIGYLQNNNKPDLNICYFTFSKKLKEQAEKLFKDLAIKLFDLKQGDFKGKVHFFTLEDYLEQITENQFKLVSYAKFREWYSQQQGNKFDPLALWKEKRGIIQGIIGANWQYEIELPVKDFNQDILQLLNHHQYITFSTNKKMFSLRKELNTICNFLNKEVGESATFREKIIKLYNHTITNKKQLNEQEYYKLNESYSSFTQEERKKVFSIFKKYETYLNSLKRQGFCEEGDLVRRALAKSSPQYDYMVIDEVQDFTEIQIYYLCQLLKNKTNIFVCGDFHQTINPTFFNVGRIESIFKFLGGIENFEKVTFKRNYRSSRDIVELANNVASVRKKLMPSKSDFEYTEVPTRDYTRKPYLFRGPKEALLKFVKDKSYVLIVVANDFYKKELLQSFPSLKSRVLTVSEIKGIERKYIITYNIISAFKEQWEEIFQPKKLHSEVYRYYFNVLYVAITRARDILGMIEDDPCEDLLKTIENKIEIITKFDIDLLGLRENSTLDQLYNEAKKFEEDELFENAIAAYRNLMEKNEPSLTLLAQKGIQRCQIKMEYQLTKDYSSCGNKLFDLEEYEEAIYYLRKGKDAYKLLKAILLQSGSDEQFDLYEEMKRFNTDPLKVLIEVNDEHLLKMLLNKVIHAFNHNLNELVENSEKTKKLLKTLTVKKQRR